jgi:hypothetical protein
MCEAPDLRQLAASSAWANLIYEAVNSLGCLSDADDGALVRARDVFRQVIDQITTELTWREDRRYRQAHASKTPPG